VRFAFFSNLSCESTLHDNVSACFCSDNVHFQNAAQLEKALVEADVKFSSFVSFGFSFV